MKNKLGWVLAALFGVLLIIFAAGALVFGRVWRFGLHTRPFGMMEHGFGFYFPLGWIGMALLWLIPIGLLVLIVAGAVSLVGAITGSRKSNTTPTTPPPVTNPPASTGKIPTTTSSATPTTEVQEITRTCQNCGKSIQPDWSHCPYCGQELS